MVGPQLSEASVELVVPMTGEVISRQDAPACLRVLSEIRSLEADLRDLKGALTEVLSEEFWRQGTKTLELGGIKAELRGGSEVVWDVEVLQELAEAGLPEERLNALITTEITYKVNANVAKQLASANATYAEIIERARKTVPKASYVVVKKGGL